jgi:hypothetical protein
MEEDHNKFFLEELRKKISEKNKLTNKLVEILNIKKESVYRRLRGEVSFTFSEIVKISQKLNISFDEFIGYHFFSKSLPFQLKLVEYYNTGETDYRMLQEFIDVLKIVRNGEYSEFGFASSGLPLHYSTLYPSIYKVYLLKWMYLSGNTEYIIPYSEIKVEENLSRIIQQFQEEIKQVKYTYFIWDQSLFSYLINDIKYFSNIRLIKREEIPIIKNDLYALIADMEYIAGTGKHSNGNKIQFYLANLNFETTHTYLETSEYFLTLIKTFTLNETVSLDKSVFNRMKIWLQALKRTSTLISESGEIQRMIFFEKQKEFVDSL